MPRPLNPGTFVFCRQSGRDYGRHTDNIGGLTFALLNSYLVDGENDAIMDPKIVVRSHYRPGQWLNTSHYLFQNVPLLNLLFMQWIICFPFRRLYFTLNDCKKQCGNCLMNNSSPLWKLGEVSRLIKFPTQQFHNQWSLLRGWTPMTWNIWKCVTED